RARCEAGAEFKQAMKDACRKHCSVSRIGFPQKSLVRRLHPFIPVGKASGNLLLHQRNMNSTSAQTTRRAFLRSAAAAAAGLAVLPGAAAQAAASSPAAQKRNIKLGL